MNRIDRSDEIRAVVDATDIVALIGRDVPLKKTGKEYQACCPFHDEKTPSFSVSPEKQFYHCFGCGAHGDAINWMQEYHRLQFWEAVSALAGEAGITLEDMRTAIEAPEIKQRRARKVQIEFEEAMVFEANVLMTIVHPRVTYRAIDDAVKKRYPHIVEPPQAQDEREKLAAQRIATALFALYGVRA